MRWRSSASTHDLAQVDETGRAQTSYDVLLWIDKLVETAGLTPPKLAVPSANSSARERMQRAIDSINRRAGRATAD